MLEDEEAPVDTHDVVVDLGQIALNSFIGDLRVGCEHDRGGTRSFISIIEAGCHRPALQPDGQNVIPAKGGVISLNKISELLRLV